MSKRTKGKGKKSKTKQLTPDQRHEVVIAHLKEINKPLTVFHLRWSEPALLTTEVILTTPAFWYLKYEWSRSKIEGLFLIAQIEMDAAYIKSFDDAYGGGYSGRRWRNTAMRNKLDNLWERLHGQKEVEDKIDLKMFLAALKVNQVGLSDELARSIFESIDVKHTGYITKAEMEKLLQTLDATDFGSIADLANKPEMLQLCLTRKVLESLLSNEGLQFVDMDGFIAHLESHIEFMADPEVLAFLGKLSDREVPWEERVQAMTALNQGMESGKYDSMFRDDAQIAQLLCGLAVQLLDENDAVRSKAIEIVPNVLGECFGKASNVNVAYEHLPMIMDNLFKILDNMAWQKLNHGNVMFGIDELIDMVVNTQHPVASVQLAKVFASKCQLENGLNNADMRNYALQNLSKIMFSIKSPYLAFDLKKLYAPKVEHDKLPPTGGFYREWLDIATLQQNGPSAKYMRDEDAKENTNVQSSEIGNDFVAVVSHGLSEAMMDPNRRNKIHAFKVTDILNQLQPNFSSHLDAESKNRYDQWKAGGSKPWMNAKKDKALPQWKIIPGVVMPASETTINMSKPFWPAGM